MKAHKFLIAALLITALGFLLLPMPAQAQLTPTTLTTNATTSLAPIAETQTSNITATAATVVQGKGMAVAPYFACESGATGNVVHVFKLTGDGDNYATTTLTLTNAANGTTAVRGLHVLTADQLWGVRKIKLVQVINYDAAKDVYPSNVVLSVP